MLVEILLKTRLCPSSSGFGLCQVACFNSLVEKNFQYGGADSLEEALDAKLSLAGGGKNCSIVPTAGYLVY